jgi:exodeoxyribonuclease V
LTTATIELTRMQDEAVTAIENWYKNSKEDSFFLAGYAGTGKSTLVHYALERIGIKSDRVAFACYTGKAALVLTQKSHGKFKASTIARLIYTPETSKGVVTFIKKPKSELKKYKLIVIDEWSMVDGKTFNDLKSFGIKILFVGDQGQLPPVNQDHNEELNELFNNPNFSLTEIHRQAEGNPIIHLSMLARTKQPIPYGWHGPNNEVLVIDKFQWQSLKEKVYLTADQIICGYNKTRHSLNQDIRNFMGFTDPLPQVGDKIICTKNDWGKSIQDISLVNGMTGYVDKVKHNVEQKYDIEREALRLSFRPDFTTDKFHHLYLVNDHFNGVPYKLHPHEHSIYNQFDYGYAITCHKSQGSQWEKVVVINEVLNREEHHRWLYTAITRSSEKLVLVI